MEALDSAFYTDFSRDVESRQLIFMHTMKEIRSSFRKNALYPYLNQLITLHQQLSDLLSRMDAFEKEQPKTLVEIDLVRNELHFEPNQVDLSMQQTAAFIRQCLPLMRTVIDEGAVIYDFVEQQVEFQPVGVVPQYRQEGYFMVPDADADDVKVYRYGLSLLTAAHDRYRSLHTRLVKTLRDAEKLIPANTIKLHLIEEHNELPNPAIYQFSSGIDFPFSATLFPVCKRLLLRNVG
jgi:hypothetical protein